MGTSEGNRWSDGMAAMLRAGVAMQSGSREDSLRYLRQASEIYGRNGMALHAAAADRRMGQLQGGAEGASLIAAADVVFAAQNIQNPARWAGMLAPGFADCTSARCHNPLVLLI